VKITFEGATVVVTGAARGIGRGIVEAFASCGARVVATDVLAEALSEIKAGAPPGRVETRVVDVTDAVTGQVLPVTGSPIA